MSLPCLIKEEVMSGNKIVEIEKAENGWIVRTRQPIISTSHEFQKQQLKVMAKVIALLSKIYGQEVVKGADEELEPWKETTDNLPELWEEIDRIIDSAFAQGGEIGIEIKRLEKEEETYVFNNLEDALNFARRFLESS
ncbi:MAG: hypothetical protein ABIK97_03490 [candidate division WOR-3 bacterium]